MANQAILDNPQTPTGVCSMPWLGDGTPLYQRTMKEAASDGDRGALMKKVWSPTPWMLDVYVGYAEEGRRQIRAWCNHWLGQESLPLHGIEGAWHEGNVTIAGMTWYGFKTEMMMSRFEQQFPAPNDKLCDRRD